MGILEGMVAGAGEALQNVGLQGVAAAIQAERDARLSEIRLSEEATIRQRGKDDAAAERTAVAGIINGVPTSKTVGVEDESGGHSAQQPMSAHERDRATAAALEGAGRVGDAKSYLERAERGEDRLYQRDTQAAAQKSNDEKWRATQSELKRFHDATIQHQAAQLGLKDKESKEFSTAVDSYVENKADYDAMVAGNVDNKDVMATAKQDVERAALKLKQFRVDVADTSPLAKHMQLSSTGNMLQKIIDSPMASEEKKLKAQEALDGVVAQIAAITGGDGGDVGGGGKPGDKYTVGQVVSVPGKGNMEYLGNNKWKAAKPADAPAGNDKPAGNAKPVASGPFPDVKVKEGGLIDTAGKYFGSSAPQVAYLQGKIDRNEALTPSEKVRAQRLKLM